MAELLDTAERRRRPAGGPARHRGQRQRGIRRGGSCAARGRRGGPAAAGLRRCCAMPAKTRTNDGRHRADPRAHRCRKLVAAAKRGEDGAVVVFDGIVRNNTRGRQTLHLDYEAYEEMAAKQMSELAARGAHAVRRAPCDDGSSAGPAGGGRDQRADRRGLGASRRGLRGLPLAHRHAQEDGAHLEEGDLCGWRGVGGGRAVSRRAGRGAGGAHEA